MSDLLPPLLPLPQTVDHDGDSRGGFGTTELNWLGVFDERVDERVKELLQTVPCGDFEINIRERSAKIPALDDAESYQLRIGAHGIQLSADTTWGALHGVTTIWQLASVSQLNQANWHIDDSPRFAWRGLHIDVARHFISVGLLRRIVEGMARLKMNVLHLHLSDDQAFRFTSNTFPKLASELAYSPDELSELVRFAALRGVRVVPELDVPGHVTSWLVNYPEWGVQPVAATSKFGVHKACMNPTDEQVYAALEALFAEVGDVFPDAYLHIGGDEVHPTWWLESAQIQEFIDTHQLRDVQGMQAYFNRRLHDMLVAQGKVGIGWDEVLHPAVPPFVVQNWRGATTRDRALARSLDCIVSAGYYLDLFYPADMHYRFDPEAPQDELVALEESFKKDERIKHIAGGLEWTSQWREEAIDIEQFSDVSKRGRVLGGEACLWSELVDDRTLETRLWSRLPAIAERLWSSADVVDVDDFYRRLDHTLELPGFELTNLQDKRLRGLGLTADQIELAKLLEPVKWYARLLGEQALQARLDGAEMPQARPYDVTTALDRVVDFISPESRSAHALEKLSADDMLMACRSWVSQDEASWPEDTRPAIRALAEAGQLMIGLIDQSTPSVKDILQLIDALYVPHGEYMLAVIPPLLRWIEDSAEVAGDEP